MKGGNSLLLLFCVFHSSFERKVNLREEGLAWGRGNHKTVEEEQAGEEHGRKLWPVFFFFLSR